MVVMMLKAKVFLQLLLVFHVLQGIHCASPCAVFDFPTIEDGHITAQEGQDLSIDFTLQLNNCSQEDDDSFTVEVMKIAPGNGKRLRATYCQLVHFNGTCDLEVGQGCYCPSGHLGYRWRKKVDRTDDTDWIWRTNKNLAEPVTINLNILYPPNITDLTVSGGCDETLPCRENTTQSVVCFYNEGNTPVTARLLDRHGVEMEGSIYSKGQVRYTFPAVTCNDTGPITCQASGAEQNRTIILVVECLQVGPLRELPKTVTILVGDNKELPFDFVSYTNVNTAICRVTKPPQLERCRRFQVRTSGTLPYLTFTLLLNNVTKSDTGRWYLKIGGQGLQRRVHFNISVSKRATFELMNVSGLVLDIEENTNLTLDFKLITDHSPQGMFTNFTIMVDRLKDDTGIRTTFCDIQHIQGECIPRMEQSCVCWPEQYSYSMRKLVDRRDTGSWIWSDDGGKAEQRMMTLNVLYNASVTDLLVRNSSHQRVDILEEFASAEVLCFWENGNPQVEARLLDKHGTELEGSVRGAGQVRREFPTVNCTDMGTIRCEAPGASHNRTTVLLVRCAPNIQIVREDVWFEPGMNTTFQLYIKSHTENIHDCKLRSLLRSEFKRTCDLGNSSLTGTPPDLTLTVRLDNVRKEEEGQWRLELTNDAGTGDVDFYLKTGTQTPDSTAVVVAITSGITAFAAVVAAVCVAVVIARRLTDRKARNPRSSWVVSFRSNRRPLNRTMSDYLNQSATGSDVSQAALLENREYAEPHASPSPAAARALDGQDREASYCEVADKVTFTRQPELGGKADMRKNLWKNTNSFQWHVL